MGTNLSKGGALAKTTELPKVTKAFTGKLKVLVLRISFSNEAYTIDTSFINASNAIINRLYSSMSRNAFQWEFQIFPTVLEAPGTKATYGSDFSDLQALINRHISAAGLKLGLDYDVYLASFPEIAVGWGGLSNMRDADWINGPYNASVIAHELGHSLGLPHAHSIEAGTDMFGIPGTPIQSNEYGNPFDVMGNGSINEHFNTLYKLRLGWEDTDEIQEIKISGIYRIYAHDNADHKSRLIGIRIPSTNPNYAYWIEYRTGSISARPGASVIFQGFKGPTNLDAWYIDTTPGSKLSEDENDGLLIPGQQISDKYGAITFKALAINSDAWTENSWVDLQVMIPATKTIQPLIRHSEFNGISALAPRIDLTGRRVNASSTQALILINESGKFNLTLRVM